VYLYSSFKLASGAVLNGPSEESLIGRLLGDRTFKEFTAVIETAVECRYDSILESVADWYNLTSEERVWYFAKFCDTPWGIEANQMSGEDLEQNIHAILIADNTKVFQFLSPGLRKKVCDSITSANYNAVCYLTD
jgi:hypothetical protein